MEDDRPQGSRRVVVGASGASHETRSKRRRGVKHWPPTPEVEVVIRRILTALADAREAAGWEPNRLKPTTELCRKRHGAVALRLFELQRDGEVDPEALIVAVLQAKVEQQRRRDGDHGAGLYAHAKSICSGEWWDSNLAAGRAWLASGGRPASTTDKRGALVPKSEVAW